MAILPFTFVVLWLLSFSSQISSETDDTITPKFQSLRDDGTTLVNGTFVFGFFSPGISTNRYIGIWFKDVSVKTVVWVANRDNPISDKSGILSITKDGNLVLLSNNGTTHHWSTNITTITKRSSNIIATRLLLLGTGNLVLTEDNDHEGYLWQSFDYPTDTLLPGMKLGWNLTSGLNRRLIAWKNWDDPSSGNLTYGFIRSYDNPQQQMWNGSSMLYRSGFWNGMRFSATTKLKHRPLFIVDFVQKQNEYYFIYKPVDPSLISRIVINQSVYSLQRLTWIGGRWNLYLNVPRDECDHYNRCGSFGNCAMMVDSESSTCECLSGFTPKSPQNWTAKEWSQGCVRNGTWSCKEKNKDGFIKIENLKVPDTNNSWIDRSMTLEECKARCWENCSCTAYANTNITGDGSGCIIWFGDLLDMRQLPESGQDLYVRFAPSQTANQDAKDGSRKMVVVITSTVISIIVMLLVFTFICWRRKAKSRGMIKRKVLISLSKQEDMELPLFDFGTIAFATNDFSNDNKLGEGGFGPVYKGTLPDEQEIAVKRLSHSSAQGTKEFKNEVIFCSKLQHRNLVKVLGFCIEEHEKLLIYEYMPNKSLDFFLFDSSQSKFLDWSRRFNIICGIARGLLYLHQDSRLRVIHRDLKAGGYMAPEYAIDGIFSIKSDVYSFGILLLEIISGKKNKGISYLNNSYNLVGHAWRLWKECVPMEFIDTCLEGSYIQSEALRCIHIGLLCVQHHPDDRPTMTSVLAMLTSDSILPEPKEPIFLKEKVSVEEESSFRQKIYGSTNEVSVSVLEPR